MSLSPENRARLTAFRDVGESLDDALSNVLGIAERHSVYTAPVDDNPAA